MNIRPKIFVIIVTYKGKRWYDKCLTSLQESTVPLHTIVVDNTPGNDDLEYIREHFPEVHIIKPEENLGFGKANNLGMRYALDNGCDYVFLLNQDAWVEKDAMEKLVEVSELHPEYGILSPIHMNAEMNRINMMYYDGNGNYDLVSDLYLGSRKEIYPVRYVNAAAWLLPRTTLETIGGFCPMIYMYGEDDDFLNRAVFHHIRVGICPDARIVHDTTTKLAESYKNSNEANSNPLAQYLDITNDINLKVVKRQYMLKYLINVVKFNKSKRVYYWGLYSYLRRKIKEIEYCRTQQKIKQPNWLN